MDLKFEWTINAIFKKKSSISKLLRKDYIHKFNPFLGIAKKNK
jgi:hypothetical protein